MNSNSWPYLAGLIDGEGTIQVNKTSSGSFEIRVKIGNTDLRLMRWLISNFGGVYYIESSRNPKHKTLYQWRISGKRNTENLLLGILPYLVLKHQQANLGLQYLRAETTEVREFCWKELAKLNKRGNSVEANTLGQELADRFEKTDEVLFQNILNLSTCKIESGLTSDSESAPEVIREA